MRNASINAQRMRVFSHRGKQVEESCIISLWEIKKVQSIKRAQHEFSSRSVQVKRGVLKHCYYTIKEVLRFLFDARSEAYSTGSRCKDVFPPATCATRFAVRIEKESQLSAAL